MFSRDKYIAKVFVLAASLNAAGPWSGPPKLGPDCKTLGARPARELVSPSADVHGRWLGEIACTRSNIYGVVSRAAASV